MPLLSVISGLFPLHPTTIKLIHCFVVLPCFMTDAILNIYYRIILIKSVIHNGNTIY